MATELFDRASSPSALDEKLDRILDAMRSPGATARLEFGGRGDGGDDPGETPKSNYFESSTRLRRGARSGTPGTAAATADPSLHAASVRATGFKDADRTSRLAPASTGKLMRTRIPGDDLFLTGGKSVDSGTDSIATLHKKIDELLALRREINRRERDREQIFRKLREKIEVQEKEIEKIEAALLKAKEALKEKEVVASGVHEKLREMDKALKRVRDDNESATDASAKLKDRLERLNVANANLHREIASINGKIGSLGNDVELHLRDRR